MRFSLLGFLLCSGLLLAQSQTGSKGTVTVSSVEVTSGSEVSSEHLQAITQEIESHTYPPGELQEIVERALYTLQQEGYFKAEVSCPDKPSAVPGERTLVVTLAIYEGKQYHLKEIMFTGNKAFSESQLRQQFAIAAGDVFDAEKIRQGLDKLRRLYASRGYINFTPVPNTQPDDGGGTILLSMDMDEGKQFYFGKLVVTGQELHPGDAEKMVTAWGPYEGKVYNGNELEQFWGAMAPFLPPGWELVQHLEVHQDQQTAIADLRIDLPGNDR